MGFFSSIKKNLNHGGVKVSLEAPGSASALDASIPVTVNITASAAQSITQVTVKLQMSYDRQTPQDEVSSTMREVQVIAETQLNDGFTLAAGETKSLNVTLPLNNGAVGQSVGVDGKMGKALDIAGKLSNAMNLNHFQNATYDLVASTDVPGIALDPSASKGISINQPGQIGATFNL